MDGPQPRQMREQLEEQRKQRGGGAIYTEPDSGRSLSQREGDSLRGYHPGLDAGARRIPGRA